MADLAHKPHQNPSMAYLCSMSLELPGLYHLQDMMCDWAPAWLSYLTSCRSAPFPPFFPSPQLLSFILETMLNFSQILPLESSHCSSQPIYRFSPEAFSLLSGEQPSEIFAPSTQPYPTCANSAIAMITWGWSRLSTYPWSTLVCCCAESRDCTCLSTIAFLAPTQVLAQSRLAKYLCQMN